MVDPDRVRDRLGRLSRMLGVLEAVRGAGKDAYLDDLDTSFSGTIKQIVAGRGDRRFRLPGSYTARAASPSLRQG